jgi:hypothetical protein
MIAFAGQACYHRDWCLQRGLLFQELPMRPPHWLDGVIGELRDADDIALAIIESPKFLQAIQKGIEAGMQWESLHEKDPKRLASSFTQEIRVSVVEAVKGEHPH